MSQLGLLTPSVALGTLPTTNEALFHSRIRQQPGGDLLPRKRKGMKVSSLLAIPGRLSRWWDNITLRLRALIIFGAVSLVITTMSSKGLVDWRHSFKQPDDLNVSITHLGYTNSPTGERLAKFVVTNINQATVIIHEGYSFASPDSNSSAWFKRKTNLFRGKRSRILPGDSDILLVAAPTNLPTWRILFEVKYYESVAKEVLRGVLEEADLPPTASYGFGSGWVDQ